MFARTFRLWTGALLTAGALALLPLTGCRPQGPKIGDVNGDKVFDQLDLDALLVILTANTTDPSPPDGPETADVALPCGGPADEADMRALRTALAMMDAVASGLPDTGVEIASVCHGGPIGKAAPPTPTEPPPPPSASLDEMFALVAAQAPSFGGVYVEDGALKVVLTDLGHLGEAEAALADVFGDHLPDLPLEAVQGRYGFNDLMTWRTDGQELLFLPAVTSLGVNERKNTIKVGLKNLADRTAATDVAMAVGIPVDVLEFVETPLAQTFALVDELRQTTRPLRGGLEINGNCTLGVVGRLGGQLGFFTNSHCTSNVGVVNGDIFFQATVMPGNAVGTEIADSPFFAQGCPGNLCTRSDAAFVQMSPGVTGIRGSVKAETTNSVVGTEALFAFQGQWLNKVGRTTGHSAGEVTDTCDDYQLDNGNYYICQNRVDGDSAGGDSGSPVIRYASTVYSVEFHGLLWGGPKGGGDYFLYTPTGMIESFGLGGIDPTSGNEPPQVTITNPVHGTSLGAGNTFSLTLEADFWDFENGDGSSCPSCSVTWIGPTDGGILGTSSVSGGKASLPVTLFGAGGRFIVAQAEDGWGATSTHSVYVVTSNSPPSVSILKPVHNETIEAGSLYVLEGTSFDPEYFSPLPCTSMGWSSNGTVAGGGCTSPVIFWNPGSFYVQLTGVDPGNLSTTDTHWVTVVPGPNTGPPAVSIVQPISSGVVLNQSQFLLAWGNDPDDKTPITYQWVLRAAPGLLRNDIPPQDILGTANGITEVDLGSAIGPDENTSAGVSWLPSDHLWQGLCGGGSFELELRAQDGDGQQATDTRSYEYTVGPC